MKINKGKSIRNVWVFDNTNTLDRYTIILNNGDLLSASANPFYPTGIGMHNGNLVDNIMYVKFGVGWRKTCNVKAVVSSEVQEYLNQARNNNEWIGKEIIEFGELSDDVQKFIKQNL